MSVVGVGIGDICLIINGTITICRNGLNTKKALQAAESEMTRMRDTVRVLQEQIGEEILIVSKRSDM